MNLLFVLEPVIFRGDPIGVSAHFMWCECFRRAVEEVGGNFALASNPDVCRAWKDLPAVAAVGATCYEIDPFAVLSHAGYERQQYARLALDGAAEPNPMSLQLRHIREAFRPDVVVMTAQNTMVRQAFEGTTFLSVEQAPLPRRGQPLRTFIDPCGHQVGSILERAATRIKTLKLEAEVRESARRLLQAVRRSIARGHGQRGAAQEALRSFRREGRIALLVTQPKDAVTYEGAYRGIELENLVYSWAEALPPGWIGVPTYHAGERLSPPVEAALAHASHRLRFLPQGLAQSLTEPLLALADGIVTISSSSAMTALLMRKKVVVVGRSPFSAWCGNDIARLDEAVSLTEDEAVSTFVFLTHRYSHENAVLMRDPRVLADLVTAVRSAADPLEWFLDTHGYDVDAAATLFDLEDVDAEVELPGVMHRLRDELAAGEELRNSLKSEWVAAVSQRDDAEATLSRLRAEHDSVAQQWGLAISERDSLLEEGRTAKDREARLLRDVAEWEAECRRLNRQLVNASARGDAVAADAESARLEASQRSIKIAQLAAQSDDLLSRTTLLQAERDLFDKQLRAAQADLVDSLAQRNNLAQLSEQFDELSMRAGLLQAERDSLGEQLRDAQADVTNLLAQRDQLARRSAHFDELSTRTGLLQAERDLLDKDLRVAQADLARSEAQRDDVTQRLVEEVAQRTSLVREVFVESEAREQLAEQLRVAHAENDAQVAARQDADQLLAMLAEARRNAGEVRNSWMGMVLHSGKVSRHLIEAMAERDGAQKGRAAAVDECAALLRREQATQAEMQSLRVALLELETLPAPIGTSLDGLQPDDARSWSRHVIQKLRKILLVARGVPDAPLPINPNSKRDLHG